jgi:PilZ domain
MEQKRRAPRRRTLKAGTIEFGGAAIDCTMRNVSQTGAALNVASPLGIPEKFTLIVPSENLRRNCRVVYRKDWRIGVTFEEERNGVWSAAGPSNPASGAGWPRLRRDEGH